MTSNDDQGNDRRDGKKPSPEQRASRGLTRRGALTGAAVGGVALTGIPSRAAAVTRPRGQADASVFRPGRPVVFRGATVVTGDPGLGVISGGDVLVAGGKIRAVGRDLPAPPGAAAIDAKDAILMPGMIDTHRHMWQTVIRALGAEWTIANYFEWIYVNWAKFWRPQDVYAGNLLSMVEAIDGGVTTSIDWSQTLLTFDYADAAAEALFDSGGRARLAFGYSFAPPQEWVTSGPVERLQNERFTSRDQLVTLQLAWDGTGLVRGFPERPAWEFAVERDLPVTMHSGVRGWMMDPQIQNLHENGYLLPTNTYVHCGSLADSSLDLIADSGGNVSVAVESELNAGQGYPPTGRIHGRGIPISLSSDTSVWWSADMFAAMRATLNADRGIDHLRAHAQDKSVINNNLRTRDMVAFATQGGAQALGMADVLGSITPGKLADLVLLRADTPAMVPLVNPEAQIVFHAQRGEVDTVMVQGRVLKYGGRLVGVDFARARRLAEESRDHLRAQIGEQQWRDAQNPGPFLVG